MAKNPKYEENFLRAFVRELNKRTGRDFFYMTSDHKSQDGYLMFKGEKFALELTQATNTELEKANKRFVKRMEGGEDLSKIPDEEFGITPLEYRSAILSALQKKVNKNYSDAKSRILVIDSVSVEDWEHIVNSTKFPEDLLNNFLAVYVFTPWIPETFYVELKAFPYK